MTYPREFYQFTPSRFENHPAITLQIEDPRDIIRGRFSRFDVPEMDFEGPIPYSLITKEQAEKMAAHFFDMWTEFHMMRDHMTRIMPVYEYLEAIASEAYQEYNRLLYLIVLMHGDGSRPKDFPTHVPATVKDTPTT